MSGTDDATTLLLIRHGETAPAPDGISFPLVDGVSDPDLTPAGHRHATTLAERLGTGHLDALYVTALRRTAQTATPLAARLGLSTQLEDRLREVYLGEWEGHVLRRYTAARHPLALRIRAEQRWDVVPGAESMTDLHERLRAGVGRVVAAHPGQRVAVVSHGGVIATLLSLASGAEPFAFEHVANGSISELEVRGAEWIVRRFNDTAHLEQEYTNDTPRHR